MGFNSIFSDIFDDMITTPLFPEGIFKNNPDKFDWSQKGTADYKYYSKNWKDGKMVSEDKVEYKDGKKVVDIHKKYDDGKCLCDDCKCKKTLEDGSKTSEKSNLSKKQKFNYYEKQLEEFKKKLSALEEENKSLRNKLDTIKTLF